MSSRVGLTIPFYFQIATNALGAILVLCALGETLPVERRDTWSWSRASPFGQIMALRLHPFLTTMTLMWAPPLGWGVGGGPLGWGVNSITNLYLIRCAGYDVMALSLYAGAAQAVSAVGLIVGLPLLQRCLKTQSIIVLSSAGVVAQTLALGLLSLPVFHIDDVGSWTHWLPTASTIFGLLGAVVMPCVRSTASALPAAREVNGVNSGFLLGALYLLECLTSLSGSQIFLPLYKHVEQEQPALCFYISACLGVVALLVAYCGLPDISLIEAKAAGK